MRGNSSKGMARPRSKKLEAAASVKPMSDIDVQRLIRMGWEDRTTFEVIKAQFGMTQNQFIKFMRANLDQKTFARWRKRTNLRPKLKQEKLRGFKTDRFKSSRQSDDGITKGWK